MEAVLYKSTKIPHFQVGHDIGNCIASATDIVYIQQMNAVAIVWIHFTN